MEERGHAGGVLEVGTHDDPWNVARCAQAPARATPDDAHAFPLATRVARSALTVLAIVAASALYALGVEATLR